MSEPLPVRYYFARPLPERLWQSSYFVVLTVASWCGLDWVENNDTIPEQTVRWLKGVAWFVTVALLGVVVYAFRFLRVTAKELRCWPFAPWTYWGFGDRWRTWDQVRTWSLRTHTVHGRRECVLQIEIVNCPSPILLSESNDWFTALQHSINEKIPLRSTQWDDRSALHET